MGEHGGHGRSSLHRCQHSLRTSLCLSISRRLRIRQNLRQRVPTQPVLLTGRALAHPVHPHRLAHLFPLLYLTSHFQGTSVKSTMMGLTPPPVASPICTHVRCHFLPDVPAESATVFNQAKHWPTLFKIVFDDHLRKWNYRAIPQNS